MADRAAAPPLPILPDDLLREMLLRLPLEPIYLFRASVVSKHWRGLVQDAGFLRRFREFHGGTPPVLGFFNNQEGNLLFVCTASGFAASAAAKKSPGDWWALDCRHDFALLERNSPWALLVWDLVTGNKQYLPKPPGPACVGFWNGSVLRAAGHGDCCPCPFKVVLVCSSYSSAQQKKSSYSRSGYSTRACVYSSETGTWSEITSITIPNVKVDVKPTALVGNTLYWLSDNCDIFEFDLDNHSLGPTEGVPYHALGSYHWEIIIMPTEDGLLGCAGVDGPYLNLWSMEKSIDGVVTWDLESCIDLWKLLGPEVVEANSMLDVKPIGFAEEPQVIFIDVHSTVYMLHLKSMEIEEVSQKGTYGSIYPYASFYSPGMPIHDGHDQAELLNNS